MSVEIYFIVFVILLLSSFSFWIGMQMNFEKEILYGKIAIVSIISLIIWILLGIFFIIKAIVEF